MRESHLQVLTRTDLVRRIKKRGREWEIGQTVGGSGDKWDLAELVFVLDDGQADDRRRVRVTRTQLFSRNIQPRRAFSSSWEAHRRLRVLDAEVRKISSRFVRSFDSSAAERNSDELLRSSFNGCTSVRKKFNRGSEVRLYDY